MGLVTSGPGTFTSRENMTLFITEEPHRLPNGRQNLASEGFVFRKLAQVADGTGGYSDIVELPPDRASSTPRVGMLYCDDLSWPFKAVGGVHWIVANAPREPPKEPEAVAV